MPSWESGTGNGRASGTGSGASLDSRGAPPSPPPPVSSRTLEHRCPKCQAVVGRSRITRTPIGKPFVVCSTCDTFVPCEPFNEWDFLDGNAKARLLMVVGLQTLVFGVIPALLYGVADVALRGDYDVRILLLALAAGLLGVALVRGAAFSAQVARSRRRVADPMYRAKLVEFGRGENAPARQA